MSEQAQQARHDASGKKWVAFAQWSGGAGRTETEKFKTKTASWRVSWKTTTGDPDPIGTLSIVVRTGTGELIKLANNLGQKVAEGAFTVATAPGEHYLEIESADRNWQVAAEHSA